MFAVLKTLFFVYFTLNYYYVMRLEAVGKFLNVTSPLCSMNKYIDIIISQNTTQFMHNMYNISHNYMFRPILSHLQFVPYSLASVVA